MATALQSTGRLCPSGRHVMDPGWDVCPYCDGEKRSSEPTVRREPVFSSDGRKTTTSEAFTPSDRETKAMPQSTPSQSHGGFGGAGDTRRIMGILITYTWLPQGLLFPVREGKNYIGAGTVNREPGDPRCDILIEDDKKLSSAHALILCRHGKFEIVDLESTNGTFIDEEMIPIRGTDLPDTANLRTGSTVWTFMKIALPDKVAVHHPPEERKESPIPTAVVKDAKDTIVR